MTLLLITQPYKVCAVTNRFLTKSLNIINMAAILNVKIFTNVKNKCLDYEYVSGYFPNTFLST